MKKRKIPILKITTSDKINYSQLKDIPTIQHLILNETINAIKDGINKNKENTSILEISDSNCIVELAKEYWKITLEKGMNYFANIEDYDKCIEIRDLISKL